MSINDFQLPWESAKREDERFKRILKRLLLLFFIFAFIVPWLPLPQIEREEAERVPPKLAKLILRQKLPAAPKPAPPPKVVENTKPVDKKTESAKQVKVEKARKKVASMGIGAFSKQLKSLRSSLDIAKLQASNTNVKTGAAAKSTRSVLGRNTATKTSGGIVASNMSTNGNGTQLSGRNGVTIAGNSGDGDSVTGGSGGGGKSRSTVNGGRDMESIRRVFEKHKGAIYAIYNRALRNDPEIKGKYVFHLVIEPSGSISSIKMVSSELGNSKLESKLLARIRMINFGQEDVTATPVNYKFDFLPG
jgi:hypothetical protein